MEPAIRTAVSLGIINASINGAPFEELPYSTLNQKYNILPGINNGPYEYPRIGYYCIGLGDMDVRVGPSGVPKTIPKLHMSTDTAPFRQRPFVVRPVDNDLTEAERTMFGLRRRESPRGVDCWVYYACRLPPATFAPTTEYYTNVVRTIEWTEFLRDELLNASRMLVDSEEEAFFNDIAIVGGMDKVVAVPTANGGSVMMKEIIQATVFAYVYYHYDAVVKDRFTFDFSSSIEEPVFNYANPPSVVANGI